MTDSITRRGWDRDRNARRTKRLQMRTRAAALLTSYIDSVTDALAAHGWRVESRALTSTHDLEAELLLRPCDSTLDPGGRPARVRWDEDTGWCVDPNRDIPPHPGPKPWPVRPRSPNPLEVR